MLAQAVHVGADFIGLGVVLADLTDLAADRDLHSLRLALADEFRQVRGVLVVGPLLLVAGRELQVDERGSVDVDVVELRGDGLVDERLQRLHLRSLPLGRGPFLGAGLEVIALDEDRAAIALLDRSGEDAGGVLGGPLLGVADLRAGDLEDERADLVAHCGPEEPPRHVIGEGADVVRRDGELRAQVAAADGVVEREDRGGDRAAAAGQQVDLLAGLALRIGVGGKDSRVDEVVDE